MEVNRDSIADWLRSLQDTICSKLEKADGRARFEEDAWQRPGGGGGRSRVIRNGAVLEKGGVNFSAVHGETPDFLLKNHEHSVTAQANDAAHPKFFATGVSIVLHPESPMVPIIHMNIRYFEMDGNVRWLGGGIDLTPHYIVDEDARFFHSRLKHLCDRHHSSYYAKFKKWADDYFFIPHRQETRGIGGIFFDRLNEDSEMSFEQNLAFWKETGETFADLYISLIERNRHKTFTRKNQEFQLLRRGRYVEFNLVYDKGTKFGLETNGRTESILMSLPKTAGWEYNFVAGPGSEEELTLSKLRKGIDWTV